jgi:hypothetical protein
LLLEAIKYGAPEERTTPTMDALEKRDDGTLAMHTPPDARTGAEMVVFNPLEWIHRKRLISPIRYSRHRVPGSTPWAFLPRPSGLPSFASSLFAQLSEIRLI